MSAQAVQKTQKPPVNLSQVGARGKFSIGSLWDRLPGGKGGYVAKIVKVVAVALFIIFLLIIAYAVVLQLRKKQQVTDQLPIASPSITLPEEVKPTHPVYANDSVILEIETDIRTLDSELISTDLEEANLNPPLLDLKITFEE